MRTLGVVIAALAGLLVPLGWQGMAVAHATECFGAANFGAAGCVEPPTDGSSKTNSWPPTSVDWPPQVDSTSGAGGSASAAAPIVLPDGQKPAATKSSNSDSASATSTQPTPIVPVGAPAATFSSGTGSSTSTPIVAPSSPSP